MKHVQTSLLMISVFACIVSNAFAQPVDKLNEQTSFGRMYLYWGWNYGWFTKSNIRFEGEDYNFMLHKVVADDRQSEFSFDTYFNPAKATIPQYNVRLGFHLNDHLDISIGTDHMKYVVRQFQTVQISGDINLPNSTYNGSYNKEEIELTKDFLMFEHTDGLNYTNMEIRHNHPLYVGDKLNVQFVEGLGVGMMIPKTNTTLLGKEKYDQFHISGYGFAGVTAIRFSFWNRFFVQSEYKGGFINLPRVRTTMDPSDRAKHHFFFSQLNVVFGGFFGGNE